MNMIPFGFTGKEFERFLSPLELLDSWNSELKQFNNYSPQYGIGAGCHIEKSDLGIKINVDMPGVESENIKVDVTNGVLNVYGERIQEVRSDQDKETIQKRTTATYSNSFNLGNKLFNIDELEANLHNGVLEINLPYSEKQKQKTIEVKMRDDKNVISPSSKQKFITSKTEE